MPERVRRWIDQVELLTLERRHDDVCPLLGLVVGHGERVYPRALPSPVVTTSAGHRLGHRLSTDRLVWLITGVAVVVFWLVSTSFRPWDLFDRAGFSSDFYDEQARVFLRGRLAVDPAVPGPEGFLIDGATYLYYGPFLALVRMPLMLFGDLFVGRLVRISMLVALVVTCRWSARLARVAASAVRGDETTDLERRWPVTTLTAGVAFSPALFASGWISVYNETELWALALAVVTITLTMEWAAGGFVERRPVVLAGAAALATTLTRAPIGFGVAFALGVFGLLVLVRRRGWDRVGGLAVVGGLLPLVAHAVVNFAKFGSLMSVPGDQQLLSLQSPQRAAFFDSTGGSFFSPDFLPTTMVQYLRPDAIRFERLAPFVRFGPLAENRGSIDVETVTPASSLPVTALLLLVLAAAGLVWIVRHRSSSWAVVTGATLLATLPTFMIGFVANRYLIDLLPPLVAAGAVGVWWFASLSLGRGVVRGGLAALAVFGLWVNASLAIWNLELKSPGFTELRYDVDRAVFSDDDPPGIMTVTAGDPAGRDGQVGVVDDCSGVYVAEQGRWVALERSPGMRTVSGVVGGDGEQVLATTSLWRLTYRTGEVTFERFDGPEGFVMTVPSDPDQPFEVVADPIADTFTVSVGGEGMFLPGDVLTTAGPLIDPDADVEPTSLCVSIGFSGER